MNYLNSSIRYLSCHPTQLVKAARSRRLSTGEKTSALGRYDRTLRRADTVFCGHVRLRVKGKHQLKFSSRPLLRSLKIDTLILHLFGYRQ